MNSEKNSTPTPMALQFFVVTSALLVCIASTQTYASPINGTHSGICPDPQSGGLISCQSIEDSSQSICCDESGSKTSQPTKTYLAEASAEFIKLPDGSIGWGHANIPSKPLPPTNALPKQWWSPDEVSAPPAASPPSNNGVQDTSAKEQNSKGLCNVVIPKNWVLVSLYIEKCIDGYAQGYTKIIIEQELKRGKAKALIEGILERGDLTGRGIESGAEYSYEGTFKHWQRWTGVLSVAPSSFRSAQQWNYINGQDARVPIGTQIDWAQDTVIAAQNNAVDTRLGIPTKLDAFMYGNDCYACHKKEVGASPLIPTVKAIRDRYTRNPNNNLANIIINGGQGTWGKLPMPPSRNVSRADAEALAEWFNGGGGTASYAASQQLFVQDKYSATEERPHEDKTGYRSKEREGVFAIPILGPLLSGFTDGLPSAGNRVGEALKDVPKDTLSRKTDEWIARQEQRQRDREERKKQEEIARQEQARKEAFSKQERERLAAVAILEAESRKKFAEQEDARKRQDQALAEERKRRDEENRAAQMRSMHSLGAPVNPSPSANSQAHQVITQPSIAVQSNGTGWPITSAINPQITPQGTAQQPQNGQQIQVKAAVVYAKPVPEIAQPPATISPILTYNDVLTAQEIAWINSLPPGDATRTLPPSTIARMKKEGKWAGYVAGTNNTYRTPAQPVVQSKQVSTQPSCTGGMQFNGQGCVCPSGTAWNGSLCSVVIIGVSTQEVGGYSGQCVAYARTKVPLPSVDLSAWEAKKGLINYSGSQIQGAVAIIRVSSPPYDANGHLAYVEKVEGNSITISEANWHAGKITIRTSTGRNLNDAANQLNIVGYFRP